MSTISKKFAVVGQSYKNFQVTKSVEIPELQSHLTELIHVPTGAKVMHIANEDPENLFCLSFQTLPSSSNGVAHILEHTVLCGSDKFPVKDPFFAMTRRSLNTFMNALTGADFTCYPASSQNPKDFYNLLEVYLDAVFHPKLNRYSFMQEGHRLEFSHPNDPQTPLEIKGIVYNEMKGALASANARMHEALSKHLFPDITYGHNSGGDPKDIPNLTYEELKQFHSTFYHPSRCLFYFYGNMPLEGHLDFIESQTLSSSTLAPPLPPLPLQPRFTEPRKIVEKYPSPAEESNEHKTQIAFGWLTCHILNQAELLALSILELILLDTDAAPLKKALLKSGLCKQVSSYVDSDLSEIPFTITLRGCDPENAEALKEVIYLTLEQVVVVGIPLQSLENALHQMEFYRSEINGEGGPFGLSLFMRSALLKQHGASSEEGLKIHGLIEDLRRRNLADPNYFTNLIRRYLLDNPHAVQVTLIPDVKLDDEERAEERSRLDIIQKRLDKNETQKIIEDAAALEEFRQEQEDIDADVLPKVTLEDVSKKARDFLLTRENISGVEIFHHTAFTNGIVYADLFYKLPEISEADLSYVRLLTLLLPQMGCGGRGYVENLEYIQAHTGGLTSSLVFNLQATDPSIFGPSLSIRGKALHRKSEKLLSLIGELALGVDFSDISRLREVVIKHYTGLQSTLNQSAMKYAVNLSGSGLDIPSKIANQWYGLAYYNRIKSIVNNIDKELPHLQEKLMHLQKQLLCLENPNLVMTSDAAIFDQIKKHRFYGILDLPANPSKPWKADYSLSEISSQGRVISTPVAFTAKVIKTVCYDHEDAPALNIAAALCDNLVLHAKVREQGGAYGSGAICNSMAANFYFYAYRDPNISSTLQAFNESVEEIANLNFDESDLEEAKLEVVQNLDTPIPPGGRGELAYGWWSENKPHERRQKFRTSLLEASRESVGRALAKYVLPYCDTAPVVVLANRDLLEKENILLTELGKEPLKILQVAD